MLQYMMTKLTLAMTASPFAGKFSLPRPSSFEGEDGAGAVDGGVVGSPFGDPVGDRTIVLFLYQLTNIVVVVGQ